MQPAYQFSAPDFVQLRFLLPFYLHTNVHRYSHIGSRHTCSLGCCKQTQSDLFFGFHHAFLYGTNFVVFSPASETKSAAMQSPVTICQHLPTSTHRKAPSHYVSTKWPAAIHTHCFSLALFKSQKYPVRGGREVNPRIKIRDRGFSGPPSPVVAAMLCFNRLAGISTCGYCLFSNRKPLKSKPPSCRRFKSWMRLLVT